MIDVEITTNTASNYGAGIYAHSSTPVLTNVLINRNWSIEGAGIYAKNSHPEAYHLTLVYNNSSYSGGGIKLNNSTILITNSIIWENTPGQLSGDGASITYSNVQGLGSTDNGNIFSDPMFTDYTQDYYTLEPNSPCINTGLDTGSEYIPDYIGIAPDMGAFEYGGAIWGCTDEEACNYYINANEDDGSCLYIDECKW